MSAGEKPALLWAVRAEWAKGRRGGARKVALVAPLPFCLLGLVAAGVFGGGGAGGAGFGTYGWNYWYVLMLPVSVALVAASVANLDVRLGLRSVYGLPLDPALSWWGKLACCLALVLASGCVMLAAATLAWALGGGVAHPVLGAATVVVVTVGSSWMVPVSLALTLRLGTLAGIAVPVLAQLVLSIALYDSGLWWALPPAATLRLPAPLLAVAPSGIPLAWDDPMNLIGPEWGLAVAVALAVTGVLAWAGARWFSQGEVR